MMRCFVLLFFVFAGSTIMLAQESDPNKLDPKKAQLYIVPAIIINGDTLPYYTLQEVQIYAKSNIDLAQLDYLTRCVIKAYPYAKITSETLNEMDEQLLRISDKKDRKKYINWAEDELKSAFEKDLRKLTYTQGRILIKLVNRETGRTGYQLIKELKGGFSAFMWQGVARLFGANLKTEFDPKKEDRIIEIIISKIESGELPVATIERKSVVRPNILAK